MEELLLFLSVLFFTLWYFKKDKNLPCIPIEQESEPDIEIEKSITVTEKFQTVPLAQFLDGYDFEHWFYSVKTYDRFMYLYDHKNKFVCDLFLRKNNAVYYVTLSRRPETEKRLDDEFIPEDKVVTLSLSNVIRVVDVIRRNRKLKKNAKRKLYIVTSKVNWELNTIADMSLLDIISEGLYPEFTQN